MYCVKATYRPSPCEGPEVEVVFFEPLLYYSSFRGQTEISTVVDTAVAKRRAKIRLGEERSGATIMTICHVWFRAGMPAVSGLLRT